MKEILKRRGKKAGLENIDLHLNQSGYKSKALHGMIAAVLLQQSKTKTQENAERSDRQWERKDESNTNGWSAILQSFKNKRKDIQRLT